MRSGVIRPARCITPAERAALDVAVAAGCVPNAVTDEMFLELRKHWSDEQVVEIVGVIAMFGFLNRWNDTFATPLEDEPLHFGETHLAAQGWDAGKHLRDSRGTKAVAGRDRRRLTDRTTSWLAAAHAFTFP